MELKLNIKLWLNWNKEKARQEKNPPKYNLTIITNTLKEIMSKIVI